MARGDTKLEYRVTWRRAAWSENTVSASRCFQRITGVQAFLARLATKFPDVTANVMVRDVAAWRNPPWWQEWRRVGD